MDTVLAVDDEAVNRAFMIEVLSGLGHEVITAQAGRNGLDLCRSGGVGAVPFNLMMPEVDGGEVCHSPKADPATSRIPVMTVTAPGDRSARIRGMEAGEDDFLSAMPLRRSVRGARALPRLPVRPQGRRRVLVNEPGPTPPAPLAWARSSFDGLKCCAPGRPAEGANQNQGPPLRAALSVTGS